VAAQADRAIEREKLTVAFTADHGRAPSAFEAVLLDQAAGLVVLDRKQRRKGQANTEAARLLIRLLGRLGVKLGAAVKPTYTPLREIIARQKTAAAAAPGTTGPKASPASVGAPATAFSAQATDGARVAGVVTGVAPGGIAALHEGAK